jgi:DNA-binding NarL/FixJ family response regulator
MAESRKTLATLLTRREVQVLKGVAQGLSEREIALRLLIFEPVVREHIRSACQKLRVQARNGAGGHGYAPADATETAPRRGRAS